LFLLQPVEEKKLDEQIERKQKRQEIILNQAGGDGEAGPHQVKRDAAKVGRNDPCPCGSGKKYKKCHGAAA
jgi:preprotein translocase subunit SecA